MAVTLPFHGPRYCYLPPFRHFAFLLSVIDPAVTDQFSESQALRRIPLLASWSRTASHGWVVGTPTACPAVLGIRTRSVGSHSWLGFTTFPPVMLLKRNSSNPKPIDYGAFWSINRLVSPVGRWNVNVKKVLYCIFMPWNVMLVTERIFPLSLLFCFSPFYLYFLFLFSFFWSRKNVKF
jgi:hypothetical protein